MRIVLLLALSFFLVQCSFLPTTKVIQREAATSRFVLDKSGYLYDPEDTSCDGFPAVMVETMPGTCLGMVLPRDRALDPATQKGFIKPRTLLQIPGTRQFLVVDMGGWSPKNGRLFLLKPATNGRYQIQLLKWGLEMPHGLSLGPDGFYYIGEKTRISKFRFDHQIKDWQLVIGDIVRKDGYMHPLSQFVFDPRNGDLYINSGSPSDHCVVQGTGAYKSCPEDQSQGNGAIYRIPSGALKTLPKGGVKFYEVAASGLRNSVAMAISKNGFLIQGENSRDFSELEEPYEEINAIDLDHARGFHYGWPYCYNLYATSPEWLFPENKNLPLHKQFTKPVDCTQKKPMQAGDYQAPWALMPPHVAPLHMAYYRGKLFQDLFGGQLIVTWHGYQPSGQRLVVYPVDDKGRPKTKPLDSEAKFLTNEKSICPTAKEFKPRGGMDSYAPYLEVISKWNEVPNIRPKGAPVSFTEAEDGSLWIVEDRENRTILRLARSEKAHYQETCNQKSAIGIDPAIQMLAWRSAILESSELLAGYQSIQKEVIQKYCTGCHGDLKTKDIREDRFTHLDFLLKNDWLRARSAERSKFFGAIAHKESLTPMPPLDKPQFFGTPEGDRLLQTVEQWIHALPKDIDERFTRQTMKETRNIRARPSTHSKTCGQFPVGDTVWVDPRPGQEVSQDGYQWSRVYVVPQHSRLYLGACPWPEDGVFYLAH